MIAAAIAWPRVSPYWLGRGVAPRELVGAATEDGGSCSTCAAPILRFDLVVRLELDDGAQALAHAKCRAVAGGAL